MHSMLVTGVRPRTIGGVSTVQAQTPVREYSKDTGTSGASSTSLGVLVVAASAWKVGQLESCLLLIAQAWELAKNDWVTSARTWSRVVCSLNSRSMPHRQSHLGGDDISYPKTNRVEAQRVGERSVQRASNL